MTKLLDIAFVIGLLVNILKASDMILRPHQQKRLQESVESLVLWLEDCKPISAVEHVMNPKVQDALLTASYAVLVAWASLAWMFSVLISLSPGMRRIRNHRIGSDPLVTILFVLINLPVLVLLLPRMKRLGRASVKWLLSDGKLTAFSRNYFLVYIGSVIPVILEWALFFVLPHFLPEIQHSLWNVLYLIFGTLTMPFLSLILILQIVGFVIVFLTLLKWTNEILLKMTRALIWRVVEYDKGIVAALVLIITVVLAISEAYLRLQR
jgi:hypothetical protein